MKPILTVREVRRHMIAMEPPNAPRGAGKDVCCSCLRRGSVLVLSIGVSVCCRCMLSNGNLPVPVDQDFLNDISTHIDNAKCADMLAIAARLLAGTLHIQRDNKYAWCAWCQTNAEYRVTFADKSAPMCDWCEIFARRAAADILRKISLVHALPLLDATAVVSQQFIGAVM